MGVAAFAVLVSLLSPSPASADQNKFELKCSLGLSKGAQKLSATVFRELSRCRLAGIEGTSAVVCPTVKSLDKIQKVIDKIDDSAADTCGSTCSTSSLPCLGSAHCPPADPGFESCSAGAANRAFEMSSLGFPGPTCEILLGHPITEPGDLAACVSAQVNSATTIAVEALLGGLPQDAGLSREAESCLSAIVDGTGKLLRTTFRSAAKCRDSINKGKKNLNPTTCLSDDDKLSAKVEKAEQKLLSLMVLRCSSETVAELDLCGAGVGGSNTVAQAAACAFEVAREVADAQVVPASRAFSPVSLIESVYPPKARCGDNMVNQLRNPFLLLGEECDGLDDDACPGECLPPGDLFECTCGDVPRMRFFASSTGSETDAGWTGLSHDQLAADLSGFVVGLENCNCSAFTGATCTGATSDPICNLEGSTHPVCSHSVDSASNCDAFGDNDGTDESADCAICDSFSTNAGAHCENESDCQSRCYNSGGVPQGACTRQSDCGAGLTCRGRCDTSETCIRTPNGGPLPVNSAGASVCGVQSFRTDVTGTMNMVTGTHEIYFQMFSQIHTGEALTRPCPVCGGFCVGGANDSQICTGRCSTTKTECRFDEDCFASEECETKSPDCPGGFCELSLVCGADAADNAAVAGNACRITAENEFFGTISNDCPPASTANTTGRGLEIDYQPWTSGEVTLPYTVPCTAPGFELYECPCTDDGGQPSKPNNCSPACNAAGPNFGDGCATGNSFGAGTQCAGGANAGKLCDDNADCPGSSCSNNPRHCAGDPAFASFACATNGDCGSGTCVDACPGGRCVPLCVPTAGDPFDGECAAGPPTYHCEGAKFLFKSCTSTSVGAGCSAACSDSLTPCVEQDDCPSGESCTGSCEEARDCEAGPDGMAGNVDDFEGAGLCIEDTRNCFLEPIVGEGGSTLNGGGSPTNMTTVGLFCQKKSVNIGANVGAGFGGPTRVRVNGVNVPNFTSIP
jgi:hypothetical protein